MASHSCASELVRRSVRQTGPRPASIARCSSSDTGHEDFATGRRNLAEEAGKEGVAQFDSLRLGLCRIYCGLGEFDISHDDSLERPYLQEPVEGKPGQVSDNTGIY